MKQKTKPASKKSAKKPTQSERFVTKSMELRADENPEAFERAFKRVVPEKNPVKPRS